MVYFACGPASLTAYFRMRIPTHQNEIIRIGSFGVLPSHSHDLIVKSFVRLHSSDVVGDDHAEFELQVLADRFLQAGKVFPSDRFFYGAVWGVNMNKLDRSSS